MAGQGPPPKDPSKRRRRNKDPKPATVVTPDDELRGPELPAEVAWHPRTLEWWNVWRRAPQAQAFTETDWDFLIDTALLHSAFWGGNAQLASELRLRVAKFGSTPEDRARLRMQIDNSSPAKAADSGSATSASAGSRAGGRYAHLRVVPEAG